MSFILEYFLAKSELSYVYKMKKKTLVVFWSGAGFKCEKLEGHDDPETLF